MNEGEKNFLERWDAWYSGLILGILFPLFWYFVWWLFFVQPMEKIQREHIRYGYFLELNMNVLRLCVGLNLVLFYYFLNGKMYGWVKGIIISVVMYVLFFIYQLYLSGDL